MKKMMNVLMKKVGKFELLFAKLFFFINLFDIGIGEHEEPDKATENLSSSIGKDLADITLPTAKFDRKLGFDGPSVSYTENLEATNNGKKPRSRYYTMDETPSSLVKIPSLYHYYVWDLVVDRGKKVPTYARRVYVHTGHGGTVFLWAILSTICFKVDHQFLYTSGIYSQL